MKNRSSYKEILIPETHLHSSFYILHSSFTVEVTGLEPVSKHILQKLSTCLFVH